MVGAMTLRLAENASLEDMVRFGVAAGSAATINQGTRLCSLIIRKKSTPICAVDNAFAPWEDRVSRQISMMVYAKNAMDNNGVKK